MVLDARSEVIRVRYDSGEEKATLMRLVRVATDHSAIDA